MRPDDTLDILDSENPGGELPRTLGPDAPAEPLPLSLDLVADDEVFAAEFGAMEVPFPIPFADDDLDDEIIDPIDPETEDDLEILLLQELGIDLDAPDEVEAPEPAFVGVTLSVVLHDEDASDDEIAA